MKKITWLLKSIPIANLTEFPGNPRALTEKGLADLRRSIEKFGIAEPLVVNKDYTICGGHGRLKVLQEMGVKEVDCYLPSRKLSEKEFRELNVRLNRNIAGEWDWDILANEFEVDDLLDWGFENWELGGWDADMSPSQADSTVTEDDIRKKEQNMSQARQWEDVNVVVCPECYHEFEVG